MKIYLVYHYTALELDDNLFEPSGIVYHVTDSLTNAICFMEEDNTDPHSWWKIEMFELNKKDNKEHNDDFWNQHHIGWYSHKVKKLKYSPFLKILQKIYKERNIQ